MGVCDWSKFSSLQNNNMAILSKPVSINNTCYELGHCWTPYCRKASTDIATHVFTESLKIYGTLYLVAGILRKRGLNYYIKKFVPETIRSSLFLTINGTLFISMFCIWRHIFGFYLFYNTYLCGIPACIVSILIEQKIRNMLGCLFFLTASFIPAYIAAFTAVIFERKSRRGPLAVYLTNLAIETGYRMLVERKIVSPVRNGEVYLFSAVSAVYLYLFRKKDGLSDSTQSLFRFFVGSDESPKKTISLLPSETAVTGDSLRQLKEQSSIGGSQASSSKSHVHARSVQYSGSSKVAGDRQSEKDIIVVGTTSAESQTTPSTQYIGNKASSSSLSSQALQATIQSLFRRFPFIASLVSGIKGQIGLALRSVDQLPHHSCCRHRHSCISYVLKGGARMFTFGYVVQAVISTLSVATRILRKPSTLKSTLFSKINLKLAAFLGGYCAVFRAVNCVLRWVRNKDSEIHGCVAGALAGLSLRFYRSVTIALYTATKLMEILYFKGIQSYGFPYIKSADIFIYAFSTAFILHAAVVEPHTLRPGYWKFLLRITDNRFAFMNRKLLDVFGVNSSKIQPDYWPDYEPNFTTLACPKS